MTRMMMVGLAFAASGGAALAADLSENRERSARELRFDRALEREHPRRTVPAFKVVRDQRRGPPYPVNWRGYPQSR